MIIQKGDIILFEGDSVTDAGRDRGDKYSLSGYNKSVVERINEKGPFVTAYNRAVAGNPVRCISDRLDGVLDECAPTVFSLLVGMNDVRQITDGTDNNSFDAFYKCYETVLTRVSERVSKIILMDCSLIPVISEKERFRPVLNTVLDIIRTLAARFKTDYVPLNSIFAEYWITHSAAELSADSTHFLPIGNEIIAREWLKRAVIKKTR
jgi:lysophospholipase L1-like esterase